MINIVLKIIRDHYFIFILAFLSIVYSPIKQYYFDTNIVSTAKEHLEAKTGHEILLTKDELAQYDGSEHSKGIYLSIFGLVYNVEKGRRHYAPGQSYHYLIGHDSTIAFITGEFIADQDDVLAMNFKSSDILQLKTWKEFYEKGYEYMGKVVGRYFDENGDETDYSKTVWRQIEELAKQKQKEDDTKRLRDIEYPPCNIKWISDELGSTVWCTKSSGGITRDWAGVPRKYYQTEKKDYYCVCVKEKNLNSGYLQEYDGCDPKSETCNYIPEN